MKLAGGRVAIYWYRCRGGELMMSFHGADRAQALAAEAAGAADLAAAYGKPRSRADVAGATVKSLVIRYKSAPDGFERLAPKTKVDWRRSLDAISDHFGALPLKSLAHRQMKRALVEWRNGFRATPRQADIHMTVLKRVFSWGVENGELDANPAEGIPNIYRPNHRADLIVKPEELAQILQAVTKEARRAIQFAAATGLRREDVCKLRWDFITGNRLEFATGKSRGRKTVSVPLMGDAETIVHELRAERELAISEGRVPSAFLLLTQRGTPWRPDSLTQAFVRGANAAGVKGRTFNDLRGTAITRFAIAGISNEQIADIVGWEVANVSNIRKRYVSGAIVAKGVADQVARAEGGNAA